jgi:peptidoglycan/LPS O-acetylase OafA/YrhL
LGGDDSSRLAKGHIPELDGLRGISILLVMLHHFWKAPRGGWVDHLVHTGWVGVDLFFVISGFLIAGILLDTKGEPRFFRSFYARRVLRIFPLYYVFIAAAFVVIPLAQGGSYAGTAFVRESGSPVWYALYLGNVREAIVGVEPAYILAPLWSLSIEEQFYVIFPMMVAFLGRIRLRRVLWSLVVVAPLVRFAFLLAAPGNERIQYLATFSRMDVLALGCMLASLVREGAPLVSPRQSSILATCLLTFAVSIFALGGLDRTQPFCRVAGYSIVGFSAASVVLWTLLHRGGPETALLRWRPLCYLGKICYGVYLLQRPAEIVLLKVAGRLGYSLDEAATSVVALKCAAAVLVAMLSWHLFEKRLLRFKKLFVLPNHPADAELNEETPVANVPAQVQPHAIGI